MSDALQLVLSLYVLLWCLLTYRPRLLAWLGLQLFRHQLQCQKPKHRPPRCPFPKKRPDCPLCQAEEAEQARYLTPEPSIMPPSIPAETRQIGLPELRIHFQLDLSTTFGDNVLSLSKECHR